MWIYYFWQKSKSKFTTQAGFVLSKCKRSAISNNAPNLIMIEPKPCLTFNPTSHWPKGDSKAFPHPITAPIKRWFKVLVSLLSLWLGIFAELNGKLFETIMLINSQENVLKRDLPLVRWYVLVKNKDCINVIQLIPESFCLIHFYNGSTVDKRVTVFRDKFRIIRVCACYSQ